MKIGGVELKTGMVVVMESGKVATILLGTRNGDIAAGHTWFPLSSGTRRDITHIYQPSTNSDYINNCYGESLTPTALNTSHSYTLLWSSEEVQKNIQEKEAVLKTLLDTKEALERELEELREGV